MVQHDGRQNRTREVGDRSVDRGHRQVVGPTSTALPGPGLSNKCDRKASGSLPQAFPPSGITQRRQRRRVKVKPSPRDRVNRQTAADVPHAESPRPQRPGELHIGDDLIQKENGPALAGMIHVQSRAGNKSEGAGLQIDACPDVCVCKTG